jgi:hypothetical protein
MLSVADDVIERTFRNAAIDGGEVMLWVITAHFTMSAISPLLP